MKKWIEVATHMEDKDAMCLFLNHQNIDYRVSRCHHFGGDWGFKDHPHYTTLFEISGYTEEALTKVSDEIKENCKHITFHLRGYTMNEEECQPITQT